MSNLNAEDERREKTMVDLYKRLNEVTNKFNKLRTTVGDFSRNEQEIMIKEYRDLKAEKEELEEEINKKQAEYTRNFSKIQARRVARMAKERQERTRQLAEQRKAERKASKTAPKAKPRRSSSRSKRGGGHTRKRL